MGLPFSTCSDNKIRFHFPLTELVLIKMLIFTTRQYYYLEIVFEVRLINFQQIELGYATASIEVINRNSEWRVVYWADKIFISIFTRIGSIRLSWGVILFCTWIDWLYFFFLMIFWAEVSFFFKKTCQTKYKSTTYTSQSLPLLH